MNNLISGFDPLSQLKIATKNGVDHLYTPKVVIRAKFTAYAQSAYITVDTKQLKKILMETGGQFTLIIGGTVRYFTIHKQSLGVGVYNVWAEWLNVK